ncbi:MAG TPA: MFS transporter [Bryobacteraceae bacterium]|nr:MFS transporter [Bryobacteraceae bacterium]
MPTASNPRIIPEIAERTRRKITRHLVPFLFLLYIISYLDRVNLGYAALDMMRELKFSNEIFGIGAGIFFVGYFLIEIPATVVVEVWSARKWIARIMITWGVLASMTGLVQSARQLYWARFFLGLAEAGFFPGMIVYLTHWFRARDRARAVALFMTAIPISQLIGAPVSGLLMRVHWQGLSGWRWLLILEGVPAIVFGVVTIFYLTDWPRDARWLEKDERDWITDELEREKQAKRAVRSLTVWRALRNPDVVKLTLAAFCGLTSIYGFGFWLPKIVQRLSGLSTLQVTLISGIPYLLAFPAMVLNGWHSDRTGERRWHTALALAIGGVLLVASTAFSGNLFVSILLFSLAAMASHSYIPVFWQLPTGFLTEEAAAACIGMINSFGNLGGFAGPYVIGFLTDRTGGYGAGIAYLGCMGVAGAALVLSVSAAGSRLTQSKDHRSDT